MVEDKIKNENGYALVELAIVMPLLIMFFIIGTIEVGNMVVAYQNLAQVANEAVRVAAKTNQLGSGTQTSVTKNFSTISDTSHLGIHIRSAELLEMHDIRAAAYTVESSLRLKGDCTSGCTSAQEDTVTVEITVNYDAFLPAPFENWPIKVTRTSPYLYGDRLDAAY